METLRKELDLLKGQSTKFEERGVKVEDEVSILKQELQNRLEESANAEVENFNRARLLRFRWRFGVAIPWLRF